MVSGYNQIHGKSYFEAIQNLNRAFSQGECAAQPLIEIAGIRIPRPLSFRELILKGVEAFSSGKIPDPSAGFFEAGAGSCSATIPSPDGTKLKFIPICRELITLADNLDFIDLEYASICGIEVDYALANCNKPNSYETAITNRAWLAALEEDSHLLKVCADFFYKRFGVQNAMIFSPSAKGLRAITQVGTHAYGHTNLNSPTMFPIEK